MNLYPLNISLSKFKHKWWPPATFLYVTNHFPSSFSKLTSLPLLRERPQQPEQPSRSLPRKAYMDLKSQPTKPTSNSGKTKKKSGRPVQLFKLSLFMLRRRPKKSKASVDMGSNKGFWRRLLGSIRPLHIQGNESPSTVAVLNMSLAPTSKPKEVYEESPIPLPSPSALSSSTLFSCTSRSSSFGTRQYASAPNLQEFDDNSEGDNGGDEMIDAKAEEFIAQFYEQMRRQR